MNTSIVLTVMADDRPGIIQTVSSALAKHGGSWTQSSMSSLAGQFAGILLISVPTENSEACLESLSGLKSEGLHVVAHLSKEVPAVVATREYRLYLVGNDHPGIVNDITSLLTRHDVNVQDLETVVESASMGGGEIFKAKALLVVPVSADVDTLAAEIEDMANDLMVDILFEE